MDACCKNPLRDDDVLDQGRSKRQERRRGKAWLDCVCVLMVVKEKWNVEEKRKITS